MTFYDFVPKKIIECYSLKLNLKNNFVFMSNFAGPILSYFIEHSSFSRKTFSFL